ncbi:MAG: hypothetical protein VB027_10410 [Gordonibacter sp.]|nr:hypothetical protein [Gordonibacter sp.]
MSSYRFGFREEAPAPAASPRKLIAAERTQSGGPKPGNQSTTSNEERERKARKLESNARTWRKRNPDAWAFMVALALRETNAQRKFGVKWLIEQARRKDFSDIGGRHTKISNTLATPLSRMLTDEHPEARLFVTQKHSILEEVR